MANINLSDGEWKLMNLLWKSSPRTISEMVNLLEKDTGWSKTTIFVMLKRLIGKGAVRVDDSGRVQQYYPMIKRKEIIPAETDSFLSRVYDGSIGLMVSSMAGRKALSEEDIAELRKILDEAEAKQGKE
ncbi:MAG: BlaI/MecI/CopY family transcriptional regulator [Ruminococcaceae bacterium]|nr:BlaI/MecI/CopY family transcriptional regulator [Oscillospiraceae bacterium]